ncbi:BTB/POZ domain-containing protein SR1IP1-like [Cynara cardunculus var. scolymus]|uniref:BTB/POZ domain-containing protein SR1IP1-like n=1 Tax=Cynara cardunculus var. scolymus TaxID=59895 RepID=UPI000D627F12|nr:BTB/POZ domain-containing protein SR1IP1-like [Cynara cardunculus var. scolymus]
MGDAQQERAAMATAHNMMPANKKELMNNAMKRTTEWIFSQEILSDVTISVQGVSFSLHKFPLVSKCGYIRKLMSNSREADHLVEINDIPGGPKGFELAAKFSYGINFELTFDNIAMVRCVAEFLEMTEDYAVGNLVARTEAYLNEVGFRTLAGAVSILQSSESLLPMAENVKLITRCVDAIALIITTESQSSLSTSIDFSSNGLDSSSSSLKGVVDLWAEDLTLLKMHTFQRVLLAMISRGFEKYALGPILTYYAQKRLQDLEILGKSKNKSEPNQENETRVVLETIVSLLPREKNGVSVRFLSLLLRSAIYLETTVACRLDLEKRMGLQLGQALLDDILIPSFRFDGDTLFDIDTVQRILMNYGEFEGTRDEMEKVSKLMENYLVEIASDCNLSVSKFANLIEHIPNQERVTEDGMYRAVDIYLKAHPVLSDTERKKLCGLLNYQKLSAEACAHAAQNERLPAETVVQVLYYEQQRLQETMDDASKPSPFLEGMSSLQKENEDLKLELLEVKCRLKEVKKSYPDKSPSRGRSFMSLVSKKFVKLTPFLWADHGISPSSTRSRNKVSKGRRHSIS